MTEQEQATVPAQPQTETVDQHADQEDLELQKEFDKFGPDISGPIEGTVDAAHARHILVDRKILETAQDRTDAVVMGLGRSSVAPVRASGRFLEATRKVGDKIPGSLSHTKVGHLAQKINVKMGVSESMDARNRSRTRN